MWEEKTLGRIITGGYVLSMSFLFLGVSVNNMFIENRNVELCLLFDIVALGLLIFAGIVQLMDKKYYPKLL